MVAVLALTACANSSSVDCGNGVVCPANTICHANGCVTNEQLSRCRSAADLTPCSYTGVVNGACYDQVCLPAGCGNGLDDPGEVCDDGNRDNRDGCSGDCLSNEACGNGYVDVALGESCDDGNVVSGDGCQASCVTASCGDGITDAIEECDMGAANSNAENAMCRTNCQLRRCGDGITDTAFGEVCDAGDQVSGDGCSFDCKSLEVCGNNILDVVTNEQCDDGNNVAHDGCWGGCLPEQPVWEQPAIATPTARQKHAMAYDAARGTTLMFGGYDGTWLADTWTWNGVAWRKIMPPTGSPPPRGEHAMAYDVARGKVVLYGGLGLGGTYPLGDTWEWDGVTWSQINPSTGASPGQRTDMGLAYDAKRKRVVLFGGNGNAGFVPRATLEWNGQVWTDVSPALTTDSPTRRFGAPLAYDPVRDRVVLFGGSNGGVLADTWEWDGTQWDQLTPTGQIPPARYHHKLAFDASRGKVVMIGGNDDIGPLADAWEWSGTQWTPLPTTGGPPPARSEHGVAYDAARGAIVVFGGEGSAGPIADVWEWNGTLWGNRTPSAATSPSPRETAMAYDAYRGRTVLFGGADNTTLYDETWEWDGYAWKQVLPALSKPTARYGHKIVFDAARGHVFMFGGNDTSGDRNDAWAWNGQDWTPLVPTLGTTTPPARSHHGMAYDSERRRVVVFGGDGPLGDTWEWDGSRWFDRTPLGAANSPSPRNVPAMAYDPIRKVTVLFGGNGLGSGETWEWDGNMAKWTKKSPTVSAVARFSASMEFDPNRGHVVLFGGTGDGYRNDLWEYTGTTWQPILPASAPNGHSHPATAYDAARHRLVVFGGNNDGAFLGDTWLFGFERAGALEETCTLGFDGDADGHLGCTDDDCWFHCTPACSPRAYCDPQTRRCGDGVCNPALETCHECPADCGTCAPRCGDLLCTGTETATNCPGDC